MTGLANTYFSIFLLLNLFASVLMTVDVERYIADYNKNGFLSSVLYDSIASVSKENANGDPDMLSKLVQDKQVQNVAIKMALKYVADTMKTNRIYEADTSNKTENGQSMCNYDWIVWLPWSGCPETTVNKQPDAIEIIQHHNCECCKKLY